MFPAPVLSHACEWGTEWGTLPCSACCEEPLPLGPGGLALGGGAVDVLRPDAQDGRQGPAGVPKDGGPEVGDPCLMGDVAKNNKLSNDADRATESRARLLRHRGNAPTTVGLTALVHIDGAVLPVLQYPGGESSGSRERGEA